MKEKKSTTKRLLDFAESYDTDIMYVLCLLVLFATVAILPIGLNKIAWAFCAPLALMLVYMIVLGILDLISSYRWYFGIPKNNKKKNTKQ